MSRYSVADAKNPLSERVLRSCEGPDRAVTLTDLDWLAARRVEMAPNAGDAGRLLTEMRDDDER